MPVDEIVITNEIPVNEPVRENDNETPVDGPGVENDIAYVKYETAAAMFANAQLEIEIPADDVMLLTNEIPVNDPVRENDNETPVDGPGVENDRGYIEYEAAADMFANAQLEIKENEPIDEKLVKFLEDDNTEKQGTALPTQAMKLGEKIMTVDEEDDVVILSQSSTSSSSSSSSGSSSSSSDPPTIMNENNVAEKYDEEHQYRPKAGSSKPKNESVDITDFCVDCEGYQCPNEAATPHHQFCKGCHEKWQMGEQPHYPHPSPVKIPNTIIKKRQQIVDERIKCLQDQIRELEESLSHVKCDLCGGEPIVNEFGHCERCAQLID
ncbi:hypothetical protein HCN44_007827 [Aphidius gifuensis]|uniref:Uncharacterized protein n=1 Tax=Aphidius gifuensis TaxID=684658 RepID=A0A834XPS7_APHGI|nr:hypothetical protein HCN44_007827 [Aphidius gifuensis]